MEVQLWNDKRERDMYENFGELYAIIKATEKLEKAYIRDIIGPSEYELECQKLITHYRTLASTLKDIIPSTERFADTYKMDCPAAINRLVVSGVPATVEHRAAGAASAASSAPAVAECVQNFITAMDSLKLNMVAVDQVHPLLSDLSASLNKLSILPPDFEGKTKMKEWLPKLGGRANRAAVPAASFRLGVFIRLVYVSSDQCWYLILVTYACRELTIWIDIVVSCECGSAM